MIKVMIIFNSDSSNTQLYSGKYVFYEDLTFVKEDTINQTTTSVSGTTGTTVTPTEVTTDQETTNTETVDDPQYKMEKIVQENNAFNQSNMEAYAEDTATDKNYFNVIIYVRFQTNIDKLDAYLESEGITPKIKYANMYYLERVYATKVQEIKKLDYLEQVFDIKLTAGQAPKEVKKVSSLQRTENRAKRVYRKPVAKPTTPVRKPYTPPSPNVVLERVVSNKVLKQDFDNTFSRTSASREAKKFDDRLNRGGPSMDNFR
jgi:hypothetical protein